MNSRPSDNTGLFQEPQAMTRICDNHQAVTLQRCGAAMLIMLLLSACSTVEQTAADIFASRTPAGVFFLGRVLQGQVSFTSARQATIHVQSNDSPALACFGAMRFTASSSGIATLSCSNGMAVAIPFQALGPLRGAGRSQDAQAMVSMAYGLPADMLATYLGVPVDQVKVPLP